MLGQDVLDHQLVDVDGVQVIRAADLYLAPVLGRVRLVGVDVQPPDAAAAARAAALADAPDARAGDRLGGHPAVRRGDRRRCPEVRLRTTHEGLHRLRPGELADLLEDLRRDERQELLAALSPDEAADALEEMEPEELASLLREAEPAEAAAPAGVDGARRGGRRAAGPPEEQRTVAARADAAGRRQPRLVELLGYAENEAGGFMTTTLVTARTEDSAADVVDRLAEARVHDVDIDAVAVVDGRRPARRRPAAARPAARPAERARRADRRPPGRRGPGDGRSRRRRPTRWPSS